VNESVDVEIELPEGENIVIRGKVVFNIPRGGFGVQFIEVSDQSRESLDRFIVCYARNEPEVPCHPTPKRRVEHV
jgi:predicted Zn-dependent protease